MNERLQEFYSTEKFGERLSVKPPSIRHALCTKGHYLGVRPRKLPNGRLLWPADAVEQLIRGVAN